jgi:hypothetical protein
MYDLLFLAAAPLPLLTGFLLVDFLFVRLAAHPVGVRRRSMLHSLHRRSRRSAPPFPLRKGVRHDARMIAGIPSPRPKEGRGEGGLLAG